MKEYDVAIIGAGPIGMASAIACRKAGLSHIMIDKGTLVNSIFNYPMNMTFFSTSEKLEIGEVPFISHNPKPTRDEALEYYRRVAMHWKLNSRLYEKVRSIEKKNDGLFRVITSKQEYGAGAVIISTGFYDIPNMMGIPGEDLPKVHHYYKEPHLYFNQKILVVGAANSAVDVALETFRKGAAEVTMVIRENAIQDNVKYWVKPDIENRIKEGEIKAFFNSSLASVREYEADIITPSGVITLENDFVLAMTGYQPDFSFLVDMGIKLNMEDEICVPLHNPETMETNVPGIYLAGVICGGTQTNKWFIENSRIHADVVVDHIKMMKDHGPAGQVLQP
jgi:thioredoxin reductase (NADPH)